jgi:LEA14-like dessication related protein
MRTIKLVLFVLIIIILIAGTLLLVFPEKATRFVAPEITELKYIEARIMPDTAYFSAKIVAKNATFFSIKLDTLNYKIAFFNKIYFWEKMYIGKMLRARSTDTLNFSFKVPYKEILTDMRAELTKNDSTDYVVNLSLNYATFLGKSELPLSKADRLEIPQPPEIAIVNIRYKRFSTKKIEAEASVKIKNHSDISLAISDMKYHIDIDSFAKVDGENLEQIEIKGKSETTINLPVEIKIQKLKTSLVEALRSDKKYHYKMQVNAKIKSPDFMEVKKTILFITKEDETELLK